MDEKELQKNIALYYSKLPPKLQEVFSSMKWLETLQKLATKHSLKNTQIETLGTETTLVLLGMTHLDEYEQTLWKELGLSKEFFKEILSEIKEYILTPILPQITEAFNKNTAPEIKKEENNIRVLNANGIKIITKMDLTIPELKAGNKQDTPTPIPMKPHLGEQTKVEIHPMLAQKLTGAVQIPSVKTEHTIENITKNGNSIGNIQKSPQMDPYREMPE